MRSIADVQRAVLSLADLGSMPAIKTTAMALGMLSAYLFDEPAEMAAFTGAGALVIVDTITGVMKAISKQDPVTSRTLGRGLSKTFGYLAVVIVAAVVEHTITLQTHVPIVTSVLWLVIATEGLSILENVRALGLARFPIVERVLDGVVNADRKKPGKD